MKNHIILIAACIFIGITSCKKNTTITENNYTKSSLQLLGLSADIYVENTDAPYSIFMGYYFDETGKLRINRYSKKNFYDKNSSLFLESNLEQNKLFVIGYSMDNSDLITNAQIKYEGVLNCKANPPFIINYDTVVTSNTTTSAIMDVHKSISLHDFITEMHQISLNEFGTECTSIEDHKNINSDGSLSSLKMKLNINFEFIKESGTKKESQINIIIAHKPIIQATK